MLLPEPFNSSNNNESYLTSFEFSANLSKWEKTETQDGNEVETDKQAHVFLYRHQEAAVGFYRTILEAKIRTDDTGTLINSVIVPVNYSSVRRNSRRGKGCRFEEETILGGEAQQELTKIEGRRERSSYKAGLTPGKSTARQKRSQSWEIFTEFDPKKCFRVMSAGIADKGIFERGSVKDESSV